MSSSLSRIQSIVLVLFTHLFLPILYIITIFDSTIRSDIGGMVQVLFVIVYLYWIFLIGAWGWLGHYTRWFMILFIPPIVIKLIFTWYHFPLWSGFNFNFGIYLFLFIVFTYLTIQALRGRSEPEGVLTLSSPLNNGRFLVAQGGSTHILNQHRMNIAQKNAMDIVKINNLGFRANGLYPSNKERYFIWDEPVYSPCDGTVISVRDDQKDFNPPEKDAQHPAGNFIKIEFDDGILLLAHLKKNSIVVNEGDSIQQGDLIGYIGNSGHTTEPHLHIHAESKSNKHTGIPIKFGTEYLKRNDILKYRVN